MRAQIQTKWLTKRGSLAGLMAAALLWAIPGTGLAQEEEIAALGKAEYQQYCSLCHGPEGKGGGLVAKYLEVKHPDLTQLSKKNEGQYPFWRVYRVVDGREVIEVHGTREMPIWGGRFRVEAGSSPATEAEVRGRILALVLYLQSIQEK